ncbi:MAG: efflux RND transporter periplasmic adaptor subunit [Verrucomicrobiota bacterium]
MKKLIVLIVILGIGVAGYYGWKNWQKTSQASAGPERPTTATVELRDISFAVNAAGEIAPAEQVSVRPEINGLVQELPVDVGDRIKKDALLFRLDDKLLQQQRASNLTDIEKGKLNVQKAERDYNRAQQLLTEKLISQELYDNTKTAFDLSKNALERTEKDLATTDEQLTKTVVRAPFNCTVLTRPVSAGQAVSGSGGFNSGSEVLTIADLNNMIINAQVNQADVPRLKVGETVEVTVEAVPGLRVNGEVERISPQATIKNNIKGYPARILLRNVDVRVRPGMTANVKIPVANADNVLSVPLSAVFTEKVSENGPMERFVYVQQGDTFEKRTVKVGVSDYSSAEIQEGLKEGEIVTLELPKEERDKKKAKQLGVQKKGGGEVASPGARAGGPTSGSRTNLGAAISPSDSAPKAKSAAKSVAVPTTKAP